ncbi:MAG: hypothetical protein GX167_08660 [Firmicutes bacterium]|jgi:uncharacterized membrane protein YkvI|nr:hypothetical protein [Bacillota bacterium]
MSKNGVSVFKIAATYIGTVVGAGFATGQEIFQFFSKFGCPGLAGMFAATVLFIAFGYMIMETGRRLHARSHFEIIHYACGPLLGAALDYIITFFLFGALSVMIAGTGALFAQHLHLPAVLGNGVMAAITAITVLSGIHGVINSISFVVPFLLAAVFLTGIFAMLQVPPNLFAAVPLGSGGGLVTNWLLAAVLYVSYNILLSLAVLGPLGANVRKKNTLLMGAFWGGLGLGAGGIMIYLALSGHLADLGGVELPMVYLAAKISFPCQIIYMVVLVAEVYTTAVGSLYGFVARITKNRHPASKTAATLWTAAAAFCAGRAGFANLVGFLYPVIGYSGIILLAGLADIYLWRKK